MGLNDTISVIFNNATGLSDREKQMIKAIVHTYFRTAFEKQATECESIAGEGLSKTIREAQEFVDEMFPDLHLVVKRTYI